MTELWAKWESQTINGTFPLRRFLSGSDHSAVFLTEHKALHLSNAAIKLVPADPATAESQLSHWRTAAALSHPHLIRLLDAGRCQLGGHQFLYVVMEYAEETLSQILPQRALTADEVRQMLAPTLDALAFLHGKNLVQGQLKPANFLVVNDQLKLATDTIRQVGESAGSSTKSLYDPPEARAGKTSPAGDVWALGVTLVEALTQCPPAWPDERSESPSLPTTLPASFADIVRRCLSRSPENRPTVADLTTRIKAQAAAPAPPAQVPTPRAATPVTQAEPPRKLRVAPVATAVLILIAIWGGWRLLRSPSDVQQTAANTSPITSAQNPPAQSNAQTPAQTQSAPMATAPPAIEKPAESKPVPEPPVPASISSGQSTESTSPPSKQILHEEIPDVPRSARNTIHGRIKVTVRVTVDASGNVTDQTLENAGPSKYFARLASEAAGKWKFAEAKGDDQDSREWLLRFEFARGGTTAHAARSRS